MSASRAPLEPLEKDKFLFLSYERKTKTKRQNRITELRECKFNLNYYGIAYNNPVDITNTNSRLSRRREIIIESSSHKNTDEYSSIRRSTKVMPKLLPSVMQNNKLFPSDFFDSSPKYTEQRGKNASNRSATRRKVDSLARSNQNYECKEHKNLGLNPTKCKNVNIGQKSTLKAKVRPHSYRVKHRKQFLNNEKEESNFTTNIAIVNKQADSSFVSLRNDSICSKKSKHPK